MWRTINESMISLCSSPFWDTNVTWNSPDPDFTPCFEKTILVWCPCLMLWLFLPLEVYSLRNTRAGNIPFNPYNVTKLSLIALLGILSLMDIAYYILSDEKRNLVDIYSPLLEFFTFCLFFILTFANVKCGIHSSGVLFLFSFALALFKIPQFRSELRSQTNGFVDLVTPIMHYLLVLAVLFLNCFADTSLSVDENVCPEYRSSFLSRLFFAWFDAIVWTGYKRSLKDEDVWNLEYDLKSARIFREFESKWSSALERSKRRHTNAAAEDRILRTDNERLIGNEEDGNARTTSIIRPLCEAFGTYFVFSNVLELAQDFLAFVSPQILKEMIAFADEKNEYTWHGYLYAIALFAVAVTQTLILACCTRITFRIGLKIRTALVSLIYRKALKISNGARKDFTLGEIVNLIAVDAERFYNLITILCLVWSAPLRIGLSIYFLWTILGPSVLAGVAVMIVLVPINAVIVSKASTLQTKQMEMKDERVKLITEILSGIKVLKLYAWETSFEERIGRIRADEVAVMRNMAYANAGMSFAWSCAPFLVSLATFGVFVLSSDKNVLNAEIIFVSLAFFNILSVPFTMIPHLLTSYIETNVSVKRINKFLNAEELDANAVTHEHRPESIIVENGVFSWTGNEGSPTLWNINVKVMPGSLVAVVGSVGAGKSSLLSAVLGEMYKQRGFVNRTGSLAYVPQETWIRNATLEENIKFGRASRNTFYEQVLEGCALNADLKILPGGDQTEIGEKGINLSGGQKQRVSLARAVFLEADTYLLDDPFSAVDAHVGKHIFERVIGPEGLLKEKTRVLVTHNVACLPRVDFIIVMKNGTISESGTYSELVARKGDFAEFLATYLKDSDGSAETGKDAGIRDVAESRSEDLSARRKNVSVSETSEDESEAAGQRLIESEATETGRVRWKVYTYYLKAFGPAFMIAAISTNVLFHLFAGFSNYWLSVWAGDRSAIADTVKRNLYLSVYGLFGFGQAVAEVIRSLSLYVGATKAAANIHRRLLACFFRWPMSAFDVTPAGRILNRFSSDISVVDSDLPDRLDSLLYDFFSVLSILVVIIYSTPIFATVIIPTGVIYYLLQRFYISTSRQLKRMESTSKSPIYSHVAESITGVQSVRAYGLQEEFIRTYENKIDYNQRSAYANFVSNRWLSIRVEMLGNFIVFFTALLAVRDKDTLTAGLVGLSVTYALQITGVLHYLLFDVTRMETSTVAVERIREYNDWRQEAPRERDDDDVTVPVQ